MFAFYKFSTSSFLDYKPKSVDTTNENKTKVEKLKSKQKSKSDSYYLSAFYEFSKNNNFIEYLKNIYSKSYTSDIENEYNEILNDEDEDEKPNKNKKSKKKNIFVFFNKTESQQKDNINKIVMFKPEYSAILLNKIYPLDDELRQNQISEYYNSIANESGVNIELLDKLGQEDFNTESFNKYALIRDWFIERLNNDTLTMELYQKEFVKVAFAEYNTKYLGWAGYKFSLSNKEFNSSACSISLMLFPVFPIYLIWQLSKEKQLETLILIYDIETGKAEMIDYSSYNYKPKKSYLKAIIYNHIYYLKNEKQIN